ncbi:hypothetical protein ACFOGJ_28715 [Marinibaculum pumilum]|uniref:Uncharacterized protein n=1 Tax=Marinibaculum pumilum TaxID=1766165 RepID=A0ABV7L9G2_9PROT
MLLSERARQGSRRLQPLQRLQPDEINDGSFLGALASGVTRTLQAREAWREADLDRKADRVRATALAHGLEPPWIAPDDIRPGRHRSPAEIAAGPATEPPSGPPLVVAGQAVPTGWPRVSGILDSAIAADPALAGRLADLRLQAQLQALDGQGAARGAGRGPDRGPNRGQNWGPGLGTGPRGR